MASILIIDDEVAICRTLELHLSGRGFAVRLAHSAEEGWRRAQDGAVDLVISDVRMPGDRDGLTLLRELKTLRPELPVIIITAYHDFDTTVSAMQGGAVDYVPKPIDLDELDAAIDNALRAKGSSGHAGLEVGRGDGRGPLIVGRSHAMMEVFKQVGMVAQSRVTVLVLGETGTGKELAARAVHQSSPDHAQPFIAVNCGAIVETLVESELFGHEKGAFTGAVHAHKGKVEQVGEGTLFLDEVAELSPSMQAKLLRLLQEREYSPVGGSQVKRTTARIIAATNADLRQRVAEGRFREDLFYRLNVVTITLPPLRQRREDIAPLVEHILRKVNRDLRKTIRRVSAEAMETLCACDWPGNVRQLENVLMKAAVMERGDVLTATHLSGGVASAERSDEEPPLTADGAYCSLKEVEREHIEKVLAGTGWHKGRTCEILGVSRPLLERRIREFGLRPD